MPDCETPNCRNEAVAATSGDGWRCEPCRARKRLETRAKDYYERCVHLRKPAETWLTTWGTPEGKARFVDSEWKCRVHYWSRRHHEYRERTEREARAVAAREWGSIRKRALEHEPYELECGKGHSCGVVSRNLGIGATFGGFVQYLSEPRCVHQPTCRDYLARGPGLARLTVGLPGGCLMPLESST